MKIGIVQSLESTTCHCARSISKGLEKLGYEYIVTTAENIKDHLEELSNCEAVFDHTDLYLGGYSNRYQVRQALEVADCIVIGSSSKTIKLCDDKLATKNCLISAGLPVPPGLVVKESNTTLSKELKGPYIIKPANEHMSRDLFVVDNLKKAFLKAKKLNKKLEQDILLEQLIRGTELRISVIQDESGQAMALPIIDVNLASSDTVLTYQVKVAENTQPKLYQGTAKIIDRCQQVGLKAYKALDILEYVRFDVRLNSSGEPVILEANCIPSLCPHGSFALAAKQAEIEYPQLLERLIQTAIKRK